MRDGDVPGLRVAVVEHLGVWQMLRRDVRERLIVVTFEDARRAVLQTPDASASGKRPGCDLWRIRAVGQQDRFCAHDRFGYCPSHDRCAEQVGSVVGRWGISCWLLCAEQFGCVVGHRLSAIEAKLLREIPPHHPRDFVRLHAREFALVSASSAAPRSLMSFGTESADLFDAHTLVALDVREAGKRHLRLFFRAVELRLELRRQVIRLRACQ